MTVQWMPPSLGTGLGRGQLWNAVVALSGRSIPLGETGASVAFDLSGTPASDAWVAAVAVEGQSSPLLVHVRDFPFRALFDIELAVADLPGLPDGLRQALFDGMFQSIRDLVAPDKPQLLLAKAQGVLSSFPDFEASEVQWFDVRLTRADGHVVGLDVGCNRSLVTRFLPDAVPAGTPAGSMLAEQLTVPADITIGSITLAHGELSALEPGAVVVMAERPEGTARIRVETMVFDFTKTENGWRCSGPHPVELDRSHATLHARDHAMNDETGTAEQAAEQVSVADLRVAIDFDIGRSMIPLSVLTQWQPGMIVDFDPPAAGEGLEVTIRANGDAIGTGDIVRIDDRIAVRITRFMLRS